jgi:hypothetical protein
MTMAMAKKLIHSALVTCNIRKSDRTYRWYYYHHI